MNTGTVRRDVAPHQSGTSAEEKRTSFWSATRLVAEREITYQIRSKGFWITFGLFVLGLFFGALGPGLFGGGPATVATMGADAERIVEAAELDARVVDNQAAAEELVRSEEVDAAVIPDTAGESPVGVRVIGLSDPPEEIIAVLSASPPVTLLAPDELGPNVRYFVAFGFALVFFAFSIGFGMAIAQSVVTEKQTRIVEILVATVPVRALLAGKIAGHSALVFAQVTVLALVTPIAVRAGGHETLLNTIAGVLGWFVPFFVLGFVLLAGIWAVAGAVVSRQEDLGSSSTLVMALIMVPYGGVVFWSENDLVMTILSYVPFSAPVAMPVRLFTGDAQVWEPFAAMLILLVTLVACVLVASRLYSGSLLQTGGRVGLGQAWAQSDE